VIAGVAEVVKVNAIQVGYRIGPTPGVAEVRPSEKRVLGPGDHQAIPAVPSELLQVRFDVWYQKLHGDW
jgi:hypothetical protein